MRNILVTDLHDTKVLDRQDMAKVYGGWSIGFFNTQPSQANKSPSLLDMCAKGEHIPKAELL
jgi:hypothetical protein